jgi:uncharacterized protein YecE (DUF72 family)
MQGKDRIHIGTSGWHYDHWRGPFYPEDLAKNRFLSFYAGHFRTVEINNSFYQLPNEDTLHLWRDTTPSTFVFSVKASRYITHMKKLKDAQETLPYLLDRISVLGDKLGPILFQLPPRWRCNHERLEGFLEALPPDYRYAFEFRDPSWFGPETGEILGHHGAAFCIFELAGLISPKEVTTDFIYIRLHGPGGAYQGQYDSQVLAGWAGAFAAWIESSEEIYCYFDNDEAGYAALDALRLQEMISKEP